MSGAPSEDDLGCLDVMGLVRRAARVWPRTEAVVDGDLRLNWVQVHERVERLSTRLRGLRAQYGPTIGLLAENSVTALEMYLAAPGAGFCLLPLNTRLSAAELVRYLDDAGCRVVIADPEYAATLRATAATVRVVSSELGWQRSLGDTEERADSGGTRVPAPLALDDPAYLYYTSGTSGRPKGVLLSQRNVLSGAFACAASVGLGSDARWLHASPMFHLADAWAIWALTWLGGCHIVERFAAERTLQTLEREAVTHTVLVPTALQRLALAAEEQDLRPTALRGLLYGGAPISQSCWDLARAHLQVPLVGTYGSTETAGTLTVLPASDQLAPKDQGAGRVGRETPSTQLFVVGADGREVADGVAGELMVRSPAVMLGYLNRQEETAAVLRNGCYLTGDLGVREADGAIRLVGRSKDMIISGGENVYPAEVENAVALHPAVDAVVVLGAPDSTWGEAVTAIVELRPGHYLDLDTLRVFARPHLAPYKLPRRMITVDNLPLTGTGKVDKQLLRNRIDGTAAADSGESSMKGRV